MLASSPTSATGRRSGGDDFLVADPDRFQAAVLQFLKNRFPRTATVFEGEAAEVREVQLGIAELLQKKWYATTALEIKVRRLQKEVDLYRTRTDRLKALLCPQRRLNESGKLCIPRDRQCIFPQFGCSELVALPRDMICFIAADTHTPIARVCEITRHGPGDRGCIRLCKPASAISMSPCDNYLIVADISGGISKLGVTDLASPAQPIGKLFHHRAVAVHTCPADLEFDSNGEFLVVIVTQDSHIQVWSPTKNTCIKSVAAGSSKVSIKAHCLISDHRLNTWILMGMSNGSVCQWQVTGMHEDGIEKLNTKHARSTEVVAACSGKKPMYASAGRDHVVRLVDHTSDCCQFELRGHTDWVTALAFHQNEPVLISAADDRTMRVWHTETGHCLAVVENAHSSLVTALKFDATGDGLYSFAVNTGLTAWTCEGLSTALSHSGPDNIANVSAALGPYAVFDFETGTLKHADQPFPEPPQSQLEFSLERSVLPPDHPLAHVGDLPQQASSIELVDHELGGSVDLIRRAQKSPAVDTHKVPRIARESSSKIITGLPRSARGTSSTIETLKAARGAVDVSLLPVGASSRESRSELDMQDHHQPTSANDAAASRQRRQRMDSPPTVARLIQNAGESPAVPSIPHDQNSVESESDVSAEDESASPVGPKPLMSSATTDGSGQSDQPVDKTVLSGPRTKFSLLRSRTLAVDFPSRGGGRLAHDPPLLTRQATRLNFDDGGARRVSPTGTCGVANSRQARPSLSPVPLAASNLAHEHPPSIHAPASVGQKVADSSIPNGEISRVSTVNTTPATSPPGATTTVRSAKSTVRFPVPNVPSTATAHQSHLAAPPRFSALLGTKTSGSPHNNTGPNGSPMATVVPAVSSARRLSFAREMPNPATPLMPTASRTKTARTTRIQRSTTLGATVAAGAIGATRGDKPTTRGTANSANSTAGPSDVVAGGPHSTQQRSPGFMAALKHMQPRAPTGHKVTAGRK